ncbi:MAG: hypothetical protein H6Q49_1368, partial [Deltaproteobacteria bacterium]|nr:hypothetical protein [Deltaproteobacteria bacterium]
MFIIVNNIWQLKFCSPYPGSLQRSARFLDYMEADPFFQTDDQIDDNGNGNNEQPVRQRDRRAVEDFIHDRGVCKQKLQNNHRSTPDQHPGIGKQPDFKHRTGQRTAIEKIGELDHDEKIDGHGSGRLNGIARAFLPCEDRENSHKHKR